MAKAIMLMPDGIEIRLSELGKRMDSVTESVLKAGGKVMAEAVRKELQSVIGRETAEPSRSTGELIASVGVSPVMYDDKGANVKVGFAEPRKKQYQPKKLKKGGKPARSYYTITNAMIANVLEYGRHGQPAKPFLKPAYRKAQKSCEEAMKAKFDEEAGKT